MKQKKMATTLLSFFLLFVLALTVACTNSTTTQLSITFDLNYENATSLTQKVSYGEYPTKPADPQRAKYAFLGWYSDKDFQQEADFGQAISTNVTFYAKWELRQVTVIFDYNYPGSASSNLDIDIGGNASRPKSPTRENYLFIGWFTDAEGNDEFDFDITLMEDITVYAKWEEVNNSVHEHVDADNDNICDECGEPISAHEHIDANNDNICDECGKKIDDNIITLTYLWNYEGAPDNGVYDTIYMTKNRKPSKIKANRDGYFFYDWFTDQELTNRFDINERVNEDMTLYACWYSIYTFEAEYTYLEEMEGLGYSGDASGLNVIEPDHYSMNASNGYYVGWLFNPGLTIEFNLTCSESTDTAHLALRLSAEFQDLILNWKEFTVQVNGTNLVYDDIYFLNVPDGSADTKRPFTTHIVSNRVTLNEGENVIKLIVSNENKGEGGTMRASAPMVDCIIIYSDALVEWGEGYPLTDNLDGR